MSRPGARVTAFFSRGAINLRRVPHAENISTERPRERGGRNEAGLIGTIAAGGMLTGMRSASSSRVSRARSARL